MPDGWASASAPQTWDVASLLMGVGCLGLLMGVRRWRPTFPTVLVVVLGSALISHLLHLGERGSAIVGSLPDGLPAFYVPGALSWDSFKQLVLPTLVISEHY